MIYNNETELYELEGWEMDADWFEGEDGLYVVPPPESDADIIGPDGDEMDALNNVQATFVGERLGRVHRMALQLCEAFDVYKAEITSDQFKAFLELKRVDDCLKRFDPKDGLYHA